MTTHNTKNMTPHGRPVQKAEALAWAAELDAHCARTANTPASCDRGGWRMLQDLRMTESYNRWHTTDDHLDYGALLRGIHNIQESTKARTGSRNGSAAAEKQFLNAICDRFCHKRFNFEADRN